MKREKIFFLLCPLFLLYSFILLGQKGWQASDLPPLFFLSMTLDEEKIFLNQTTKLKIEWKMPIDYEVDSKKILKQLSWSANLLDKNLEIIHHESLTEGIQVELKPLKTGLILFSLLNFTFQKKGVELLQIETPVWNLEVSLLEKDLSFELKPAPLITLTDEFPLSLSLLNREKLIDNPLRELEEQKKILKALKDHTFPWNLFFVVLGLGAASLFIYLSYPAWIYLPSLSPASLNLEQQIHLELKNLKIKVTQLKGSDKAFYHELTQFVAYLLSIKTGFPTLHYTTEEWKTATFLENKIDEKQFLDFLKVADEVKFAKIIPSLREKEQAFQYVEKLAKQLLISIIDSSAKSKAQILYPKDF